MQLLKKITAICLALLVLTFAGGLNITKHLCNDKVVAKSINWEVKKCKAAEKSSLSHQNESIKKTCCGTEFFSFQSSNFAQSATVFVSDLAPLTPTFHSFTEVVKTLTPTISSTAPLVKQLPIFILVACFRI